MDGRLPNQPNDLSWEVRLILQDLNTSLANGPPDSSVWKEYPLSQRLWIIINEHLTALAGPLQYGYFSRTETFVHQVPSPSHESLSQSFAQLVTRKLYRLCREQGVRTFAGRVVHAGPPDSKAGSNSCRDLHQPDIFFSHVVLPKYGVAVEITYAEKRDRLQELAEFYMLKSNRNTRLFINIDYDRGRTWKVTLRTWRRDYTDPIGLRLRSRVQELRGEDGTLVPGPPLRVCMLDFARQELVPPFLHGRDIELSVEELGSVIEEADASDSEETDSEQSDNDTSMSDDPADTGTEEVVESEWPFERPGLLPFP
ncbi:uncharacterized protein Z520_12246 [Fonsecaea multimorphosa CBS 102226]|uniref:Uncharacterized protein n=1 Tax=Fonsecaea multimorphosa CBS 102226 TaxID=1442371 RepID=A0A0D2I402_9EURO|nr:uncharacterized protein Z520_12246 [Fonsecaea multimorphosa CBS 102226]KIX92031.1 hypothetical protein Z520_12246 [Fonsecaea multimorphosa CBS 102226]OAL17399.1 hypothetical protein AYO22_11679 [Fonsecaea multimorphosa]